MERYSLEIVGLCETRWTQAGKMKINSGKTIIYAGHEGKTHGIPRELQLCYLNKQKALIRWEPINSRIIRAKVRTSNKTINLNVITCYAPTNDADLEKKKRVLYMFHTTNNYEK